MNVQLSTVSLRQNFRSKALVSPIRYPPTLSTVDSMTWAPFSTHPLPYRSRSEMHSSLILRTGGSWWLVSRGFLDATSTCQESPSARMPPCAPIHAEVGSNQFLIHELDRSLPSDTFQISKDIPTLSSQPQHMEQPSPRCRIGLLEPSLTVSSSLLAEPVVKEETLSRKPSPPRRNDDSPGAVSKNRWKPNSKQLDYLEQHFRTGAATPVLET